MNGSRRPLAAGCGAFVALLVLTGCMLDPEASAALRRLNAQVNDLVEQGEAAAGEAAEIGKRIQEVKAKAKAGEIDMEFALAKVQQLGAAYQAAKARAVHIAQRTRDVRATYTRLRDEFGVPWWQIAGSALVSLLVGGSGAGLIARVGNRRLRAALETARTGLGAMVSAVEHNDATRAVKAQMSRVSNPEVEAAVAARQEAWDTSGPSR